MQQQRRSRTESASVVVDHKVVLKNCSLPWSAALSSNSRQSGEAARGTARYLKWVQHIAGVGG
jgi:hypothetical protein